MSDSCDSMHCSLPGSSIHGILQAGILEWVVISFSTVCLYIIIFLPENFWHGSLEYQGKGQKHMWFRDFPGGSVVKNPSASAGNTGSIPDPGRFHMLQSNWAHVPQPLSLYSGACNSWAHVLQLWQPARPRALLCIKRSHRIEKPTHHN